MNRDSVVWLRPDARVEPLVARWLADHHLVPPLHRALKVARSHLPVLQSFLQHPKRHAEAAKVPALRGGAFVALDVSRVEEIRALVDQTTGSPFQPLALAADLQALDDKVAGWEEPGIESLYPHVPERLRGLVELFYDVRHRPRWRILESLVYRSELYRESDQSVQLSLATDDDRTFGYSTPRLDGPAVLTLPLPFRSKALDLLARSRVEGTPFGALVSALEVREEDAAKFATFFTDAKVTAPPRYDGPGVRIRYFGHACVLMESAKANVLVDPSLPYPFPGAEPRSSFAELPERIDYVLITHSHADHLSMETLLQLRPRIGTLLVPRSSGGNLSDPALAPMLHAMGFPSVRAVDELESIPLPNGRIEAIPFFGEHGDLDILSKASWLVELEGKRIFIGSDASVPEPKLYERLADLHGVDAMFYAVEANGAPLTWGNGPLLTKPATRPQDQTRRQGSATGAQMSALLGALKPKRYYSYALGLEPWLRHVIAAPEHEVKSRLKEVDTALATCQSLGIPGEKLYGRAEFTLDGNG